MAAGTISVLPARISPGWGTVSFASASRIAGESSRSLAGGTDGYPSMSAVACDFRPDTESSTVTSTRYFPGASANSICSSPIARGALCEAGTRPFHTIGSGSRDIPVPSSTRAETE